MTITTRTTSLALTAATLLFILISMGIEGDHTLQSIFILISLGFGACSFASWVEYFQERRINRITK